MSDLQKFIDELRAKVSIVDVVAQKVKLIRKGKEHSGLCPFHNEKTPSFTVNEAKGFYHCFGCGAHGDIVKFEMEANGLPFMDSLEKLSHKAGVSMPRFSSSTPEVTEKRKSYYDILEMATKYFEKNLRLSGGNRAYEYLKSRGFDDDIITKFRLGYAPNNNGLRALLASKDVAETDIITLGLAGISDNQKIYDFFRDRVIVPIMDKQGRVIAYGGRILGDGQPKYLNSPDTPVFNKRDILYNIHNAREQAFASSQMIICEGYMDVIALDKYGFSNAVAPLGTALTEEQISQAWKICPEPTLCFDGDSAGVRAGVRSLERALPILKAGYSLNYAFLPDKKDPDDYLKENGAEAFKKILEENKSMVELLWDKNFEGMDLSTPEQKALFEKNIFEDVAKIADEKIKGYYFRHIKEKVDKEFGIVTPFVKKNYQNQPYSRPAEAKIVRPTIDDRNLDFVIAAIIHMPKLISDYEEKILMFEIASERARALISSAILIYNENQNISSLEMIEKLSMKGFSKEIENIWEVKMLKQQNTDEFQLKEDIDMKILETQIKYIDMEIRECLRIIEKSVDFPEEVYQRCEALKKEKEASIII